MEELSQYSYYVSLAINTSKFYCMPYLSWISDKNLTNEVDRLLLTANRIKESSEERFEKNVIDPFSALIQMSGFGIDYKTWHLSESTRQAQKSLQNHIGDFHQNILGHVDGWTNLATGGVIDLVCPAKKIIAEVKNKLRGRTYPTFMTCLRVM